MRLQKWQIRVFLAFTIVYPIYYLGRYNYVAALPMMMKDLHWSHTMVGTLATVLTLTYAFGQLINGFFADRYGARLMLTLGGIMSTVMNVLTSLASSFVGIMSVWGLNGYFQAMGWNSVCKLSANWFPPKRRGLSLSVVDAACGVVTAIIPVLCVIIIVDLGYGWRGAFWLPPLVLVVACVGFYLVVKNKPSEIGIQVGWAEEKTEGMSLIKHLRFNYGGAFADWRMIACYGVYGCTQFCRFGLITWLPTFLFETTGRSLLASTLVASIFEWGASAGSIVFGWASDKFKRIPIIVLGLLMGGVAMFVLTYFPMVDFALLVVIFTIAGIGVESIEIPLFLVPIDILGEDRAGTTAGAMNCVGKLGAALQGFLLGFLIDSWGYTLVFTLIGFISLLGIVLIYPIWKLKHLKLNKE